MIAVLIFFFKNFFIDRRKVGYDGFKFRSGIKICSRMTGGSDIKVEV